MSLSNTKYDYIITGMGAAGLSLAMQLRNSGVPFQRVLLIDEDLKQRNDRTWCFWAREVAPWLQPMIYRSWDEFQFKGPGFEQRYTLKPFQYHLIKGIDFYRHCLQTLQADERFHFVHDHIQSLNSLSASEAEVITDHGCYKANHVFNSAFRSPRLHPADHNMVQHFRGWVVRTNSPAFEANCPVFMDFQTPQEHDCRFFYVIPFSDTEALVEYTGFSPQALPIQDYEEKLQQYLQQVLQGREYTITETEMGEIPMVTATFTNPFGEAVTNIGTAAGCTKPSTGYTFYFIQQHIARIVRALEQGAQPPAYRSISRFHYYDRILLEVIGSQRVPSDVLFTQLFRHNPISHILSFLNEDSSFSKEIGIMYSLPWMPFMKAALTDLNRRGFRD